MEIHNKGINFNKNSLLTGADLRTGAKPPFRAQNSGSKDVFKKSGIEKTGEIGMDNVKILNMMIEDYKQLDEVDAIVLGGSSSAKSADNRSDYDIYIYCSKEPLVEKRREIALKYSDNPEIDNHYFETGDVYYLKSTGKPIDIMYRSLDGIENNIKNVWIDGNASMGYTTCFVDNVNKSQILFDREGKFKKLQEMTKTPYPEKLRQNIINKNFSFLKDVMFSYHDQIESAVARKDYVSINHRTTAFLASYFDALFAVNRVMNPGEKRLVEFAKKNCKILPENFERDVNNFASGSVVTKLDTASSLVENLRKIIDSDEA